MTAAVSQHSLVWNNFVYDGSLKQPVDRNRAWEYGAYAIEPGINGTVGTSGCYRMYYENNTIKVKYTGREPINPDILTARYENTVVGVNLCKFFVCGFFCCPCYFLCCFEEQGKTIKEENARKFNAFIAKTLAQADLLVGERIAAIRESAIQVTANITTVNLQSNNPHIARLEKQVADQKRNQELESQLKALKNPTTMTRGTTDS